MLFESEMQNGRLVRRAVLNSERAVVINIEIMRTFVRVRTLASSQQDLAKQLAELQDKTESMALSQEIFSRNTRNQLRQVFDTLRELMTPPNPPKRPIGFITPQDLAKDSTKEGASAAKTGKAAEGKAARVKAGPLGAGSRAAFGVVQRLQGGS